MKHVIDQYGHHVKVSETQIQPANKELIKVIPTIHLLHKHWVLVVTHIRKLVISCQKIWFHSDYKYIHQKMRGLY